MKEILTNAKWNFFHKKNQINLVQKDSLYKDLSFPNHSEKNKLFTNFVFYYVLWDTSLKAGIWHKRTSAECNIVVTVLKLLQTY